MTNEQTAKCMNCGQIYPERLLDAKPVSLAGIQADNRMLVEAADRGEDFVRLECAACYGPAWEEQTHG